MKVPLYREDICALGPFVSHDKCDHSPNPFTYKYYVPQELFDHLERLDIQDKEFLAYLGFMRWGNGKLGWIPGPAIVNASEIKDD